MKKAELLHVITQPQPTEVCEGSTARFTSKVQLKAGLLGQIGYQWQVSADQTSWSDVGTTRYANSDEEVELLVPNTTVSQHNDHYYRVRYTYERTAAICDAKVTEYSQTAKLTVYGKAEVTKLTTNPGSIAQGVSTPVTFAFKGTPGATVVYTVAGGAPAEITLNAQGEATKVIPISQATTLAVVQVKKGDCTYPSTQKIEVTAGCGANKPEPQFATGLNVKKTMNGVEVTRDLDGNISYSSRDTDPAYCNGPYEAGYVWMGRHLDPLRPNLTTKTTYHFDAPVTSAEIWFMGMGRSGFVNREFRDRAKITVNCGTAQVTRVSDCRDNSSDTYSKVINGNEIEGKRLTDMVVRVTSDKPFTRIVIEDGNSDGLSDPAAYGYYVELCPSSIQKAEILSVEQEPQSENHCEGDTTAFTAKAQLETGYTGQIAYQWQSSTDALTWTDMTGKSGNTASGTAQVLDLVTTRSMDDTWYRVKYIYTESTPLHLCNGVTVTRYSEAAKLNVTGVDKPILSEVSAADCAHDRVMKITNVDIHATYSFVRTSDNASVNGVVGSNGEISALPAGKYKVTATKNNCSSEASDEFEIIAAKGSVIPVVQEKTFATCDEVSEAKITNYVPGTTYHFEKADGTAVTDPITVDATDGTITGLAVGKYKVRGEKDGCTSDASAEFEIKDKLVPVAPTVAKDSDPTCDDPTIVKITNYIEGGSYTFVKTADDTEITTGFTIDRTTGKVTGLAAAKYKVKVKVNECTSALSDEFEVKAKKPTPAKPTIDLTAESCTAATVAKISNYVSSGVTYTFTKADGTAVTGVSVANSGVISGLAAGTYKVKAEKDGCTSDISDNFEIKTQKAAPAKPMVTLTAESCAAPTKAVISNYVPGQTYWNGATQLTVDNTSHEITNLVAGTYTITAKNNDNCESVASDSFEIKAQKEVPAKPTIDLTAESCTAATVAKISNYVSSGVTYTFTKADGTPVTGVTIATDGVLSGLAAGTYKVKAEKDGCESEVSEAFEIKDQQTAPAKPTVTLTAESCTAPTKAVISNYASGQTYWNGATQLTVDDTSHEITGLAAGTYTITTKIGNCESVASDSFEIKAQKAATIIGANPQSAVYVKDASATPLTAAATGEGTLTYKWYKNTTNSYTGGTEVGGDNTYTPATDTVGSLFYWAEITGECGTEKTSIAEIKVTDPDATPRRAIKAVDDNFGKVPNTVDYTTTNTVFSTGVDTLEGVSGILSPETDVILHKGAVTRQDGTAVQDGTVTMNNNGSITVKKGTPVGVYTYTYFICEKVVPTNCSEEAKATFEVVDNPILAKDDVFEMGTLGGLTPSVLNNDIFAGKVGPTTNEVIVEKTLIGDNEDTHLEMRKGADGRIDVRAGIAPGIHKYYYTISDKNDKTKSSSAVVTIKVVTFAAGDDEHEVFNNNGTEQHIDKPSIFDNDEVDHERPKPGNNVTFTSTSVKDKDGNEVPGIVINPQDGTITVASGTPDGVYTYSYTICKIAAPDECKTAKGVLKLLPALEANDDDFTATPVNTTKGAVIVGNVLENDLYAGGKALDNIDKVTATIREENNGGLSGVKIDEQGNLIIPQGTPVGVYDNIEYNLCMKDHPGACKTAKIKVEVIKDKPLTIYNGVSADGDGQNDYFKIDGIEYYPKNNLKIFNRWGVLVYEKDGYSNNEPFDGHSNGRATISADSKLPQGTYYYILEYEDSEDQSHTEKGWLYLKY